MAEFKIVTIQVKRANADTWTSQNPVLADGEMGFERDTNQLKVGNGSDAWTSLSYLTESNGSGGIVSLQSENNENLINIRVGTSAYLSELALPPIGTTALEFPTDLISNVTEKTIVNLFNKETTTNGFLSTTNFHNSSTTLNYSYYIPVKAGETYKSNQDIIFSTYFDATGVNVIGGTDTTTTAPFTIPAGVSFVRITTNIANNDTFQLVQGDTNQIYTAFVEPELKLTRVTTAQRPIFPPIGTPVFDTDLGIPIYFNGIDWIDALGIIQ